MGKQFAGATQLLPIGISDDEAAGALKAFCNALQKMYSQNGDIPKLPADSFRWKEFRTPTKNLLVAVSNALIQAMPEGFNLQKCIPSRLLVPRSTQGERIPLDQSEKAVLGLGEWPADMTLHFVYNFSSQSQWLDFQIDNTFTKLCFAADEGTEVPEVKLKSVSENR